jgi:hypothetical protein
VERKIFAVYTIMKQRNTIKRRAIQEHPEEIEKDASLFVFTIELMLIRDKIRSILIPNRANLEIKKLSTTVINQEG